LIFIECLDPASRSQKPVAPDFYAVVEQPRRQLSFKFIADDVLILSEDREGRKKTKILRLAFDSHIEKYALKPKIKAFHATPSWIA
jgi:hypothetical protein